MSIGGNTIQGDRMQDYSHCREKVLLKPALLWVIVNASGKVKSPETNAHTNIGKFAQP